MAVRRAQVSEVSALAAWLNENATAFFSSVNRVGAQEIYQAVDLDGNTVFQFDSSAFTAYRTNGSNPISASGGNTLFGTTDIIMCDNGIILDTTYTRNIARKFGVLIAKTNNDKTACIFSYGDTVSTIDNYLYTQLQHVAFGDSATLATTTTFPPESGQQTNFCTFCTNADIEDVSYTPKAFYMPMHSAYNSGIGKFLSGGKLYITNGYWAIDTEQTEEDAT